MMRYSVQPRNRIIVKNYGILSFAKNMGKNIGKNISQKLSGKYSQKRLDHTEQFATDAVKTISKRAIQKAAEAAGIYIGNEIADRVTKVSKIVPHNNLKTVTNKYDKKIPKKRYATPEQRQKN